LGSPRPAWPFLLLNELAISPKTEKEKAVPPPTAGARAVEQKGRKKDERRGEKRTFVHEKM
jgi:hypothetical protein